MKRHIERVAVPGVPGGHCCSYYARSFQQSQCLSEYGTGAGMEIEDSGSLLNQR